MEKSESGNLPVTKRDIELVNKTWNTVKEGGHSFEDVGRDIIMRLFEISPEVKSLFSFGSETNDELRESPGINKHANDFVTMVDKAIQLLSGSETEKLTQEFKELGRKHHGFGTRKQHFQDMGRAVLTTLENKLGEEFTKEVCQAWIDVFVTAIASTMAKEMDE